MILLLGQVARPMRGREAFQEIDPTKFFSEVAKSVEQIDRPERIPEAVSRAFHLATSGRPGPVVLSLPEDMLRETAVVADAAPWTPVETFPGADEIARLRDMLGAAKRPFVILGGSRWSEAAVAGLRGFAERFDLPVGCSFRRQMLFDNDHPNYAGDVGIGINPALAQRVKDADVLLLVGGRMSEMPSSGYTLIDIPEPRQALIHVHPAAEELGRVYRPSLAINASPIGFVAALAGLQPPTRVAWAPETRAANAAYRAWSTPTTNVGPVQLAKIVAWLRERLPDDAILANGAGNYSGWLHRFFRYRRYGGQLAPTSGTMGYGLPAAIAAKLKYPERSVVAFAGDGCFQLTSQEFATAVAVPRPGRAGDRQQRRPRHHPHAPGARLSRTRHRDRPRQSRFRGARPGLRGPRRDGRRDRGVRARLRTRDGFWQAGDHRGQVRGRGDYRLDDAVGDPGQGKTIGRRRAPQPDADKGMSGVRENSRAIEGVASLRRPRAAAQGSTRS